MTEVDIAGIEKLSELLGIGPVYFHERMPKWARDLTTRVCNDYGKPLPCVKWSEKNRQFSTGRAYSEADKNEFRSDYDVSITAGTLQVDVKLVLLHELAHWLNPLGEHHGRRFWETAFDLYARYGISLMYAHGRERRYRAMAEEVGWERVEKAFYSNVLT